MKTTQRSLTSLLALTSMAGCVLHGPVREGFEVVPGSDIHWETRGGGAAIVLLHGGGLDLRQWDDEVGWLSRGYLTLRYDQRGHGQSPPSASPYSSHEDLRELLDALGIGRAVLVGHSNGGRVALDFALEHPQRVAGLFLLAPGLSGWPWNEEELDGWLPAVLEAVDQDDPEAVLERWLASPFLQAAMERPPIARRLRSLARDNVGIWFQSEQELLPQPPVAKRMSELGAPVCVLVGQRDMPDLVRIAEALGVHVAGARVVRLEGVGHMVDMEAPRRVRAELGAFLEELAW